MLPNAFNRLKDTDSQVRKNAATLIREICKRNDSLAQKVVFDDESKTGGGLPPLKDFILDSKGTSAMNALPAVMSLGFIAAWREDLAEKVLENKGIDALQKVDKCPVCYMEFRRVDIERHTQLCCEKTFNSTAREVDFSGGCSSLDHPTTMPTKNRRIIKPK